MPARVVAAVLEPAQPLDQDVDRVLRTDVPDDAAHAVPPLLRRARSEYTSPAGRDPRARGSGPAGLRAPSGLGLLAPRNPARMLACCGRGDRQRARRHVLGDRRPGGDVRAVAHAHGRDELRVAADEHAGVPGVVSMLVRPVVVAGDRSGADVAVRTDRRVAQVGSGGGPCSGVRGASSSARRSSRPCARPRAAPRPQVRERPEPHAVADAAVAQRRSGRGSRHRCPATMSVNRVPERMTQSSPIDDRPSIEHVGIERPCPGRSSLADRSTCATGRGA